MSEIAYTPTTVPPVARPTATIAAAITAPAAAPPAVSIVIPAYNAARYIGEALDSVLAQTFADYEIIVVNDGSPDTVELECALEPYRGQVRYLVQENGGPGSARNTAFKAARGRYLALLDADDVWEPEYLAVQVSMLERDPTLDVVYSDGIIFGDGPDVGRKLMEAFPSHGAVTFESVVRAECTVLICAVARREAIINVGMFDETLRAAEDFDLWLRVIQGGGRIAYHRQPLARYRRVQGSRSSDPIKPYEQVLRVFEKASQTPTLTASERETLRGENDRFRALLRLAEGQQALARRDVRAAIDGLSEANTYFRKSKLRLALVLLRLAPQLFLRVYGMRGRRTAV
ncbi:MAG: glycosyltransferase family 2 protein [Pyrinomonadaceae bacterium]|nr:glycosyltransferase family 2 protein [Pyrinomonadaceae bacterium]